MSTISFIIHLFSLVEALNIWQDGVYEFISFWLHTSYYPDFVTFSGNVNSEEMAALHNFITTTFLTSNEAAKDRRTKLLMLIRDTGPWLEKSNSTSSFRISRKKEVRKRVPQNLLEFTILDLEDKEAAEGLTRLDAGMMRSMRRAELVSPNFENLKFENRSAHYVLYAERLKKMGGWIATQLLVARKLKERVRIYRKWVLIAKQCAMMNNFSSMCAILAGLSHQSVDRLTHLLREIPADVMNLKREMEENFMGFSDNHVRGLIQHCIKNQIPCIPTIDVLRKDLLRIDEGSKGDDDDGLLKFFKIVSFGKAVHFIEQAYLHPFEFEMERGKLTEREILSEMYFSKMPNAVTVVPLLMRMSFEVQPPSGRESKNTLYKDLIASKAIASKAEGRNSLRK